MENRLPEKWQTLFEILARELEQASPTSMSQGLRNFLMFILQHKREYESLAQCGADLDFVTHVLYVLVGFPTKYLRAAKQRWIPSKEDRQVLRETWKALPGIECLEGTIANEGFAALSDDLQTTIHTEVSALRRLRDSFNKIMESIYQKVEATDPLVILLARTQPHHRGSGRPSAEIPTLFMVLLTEHLQEQTGRRRYREIGLVAHHLFDGSILDGAINDPTALREAVQDRCKKFKKNHDMAAIRTALLATETPFLKRT